MVKITKSQVDVALLHPQPQEIKHPSHVKGSVQTDPEHEWHCQNPPLPHLSLTATRENSTERTNALAQRLLSHLNLLFKHTLVFTHRNI